MMALDSSFWDRMTALLRPIHQFVTISSGSGLEC